MRDVWERSELISSALYFILKGKSVDSVKPSCARGESAIVRIVYETLHYSMLDSRGSVICLSCDFSVGRAR